MFKKCLVVSHEDIGKDLSLVLAENIESEYSSTYGWNFSKEGRCLHGEEEAEIDKAFIDYYSQYGKVERTIPSYSNVVIIFNEEV